MKLFGKSRLLGFPLAVFVNVLLLCACGVFEGAREVEVPEGYRELMKFRNVVLHGGSGGSPSDAIIVKGALNAMQGAQAERMYLEKLHPGFILSGQSLLKSESGRMFDCLEIFVKGGAKERFYFDITEFYGR